MSANYSQYDIIVNKEKLVFKWIVDHFNDDDQMVTCSLYNVIRPYLPLQAANLYMHAMTRVSFLKFFKDWHLLFVKLMDSTTRIARAVSRGDYVRNPLQYWNKEQHNSYNSTQTCNHWWSDGLNNFFVVFMLVWLTYQMLFIICYF